MKWHAPHPANPKLPACGTVGEDGAPTHRVAKLLTVTCMRCKKVLAKQLLAGHERPNVANNRPAAFGGSG